MLRIRWGGTAGPGRRALDWRRSLQLGLAGLWLLDALLQYQPFMFTGGFAAMLATAARGNPAVVASSVTWGAHLTGQHPVLMNAAFATIQLLLALGIAWRPTVKIALAASACWALAVWWFGEGAGGLLTPGASPVTGAPGAALLYGAAAVVLWPPRRERPAPFVAGRVAGPAAAQAAWIMLWGGLAWLSLLAGLGAGAPGGLSMGTSGVGSPAGSMPAGGPSLSALLLAVICCLIAAGIMLPPAGMRAALVVAGVVSLVLWAGQDFGGLFTGQGTDPGTGPLLALLAAAYWPRRTTPPRPARAAPRPGMIVMQAVMGLAMAAMIVPAIDPLPRAAWQALAVVGMAWFAWRFLRELAAARPAGRAAAWHHLPHVIAAGAMLDMLARPPSGGPALAAASMAGGADAAGLLALCLAVALAACAVITADRLHGAAIPQRAALSVAGRTAVCCQIAMAAGMAYLLTGML